MVILNDYLQGHTTDILVLCRITLWATFWAIVFHFPIDFSTPRVHT